MKIRSTIQGKEIVLIRLREAPEASTETLDAQIKRSLRDNFADMYPFFFFG